MTSQDTEALKALVALARKLPKLPFAERDGVQNADFAMATVKALPALERMLASQGEQREAQGTVPVEWLNKLHRYTWHGVMAYPLAEEQWVRADAIDALIKEDLPRYSATPLAESVGDAHELAQEICDFFEDPGYITVQSVEDIIRRHMQQGK